MNFASLAGMLGAGNLTAELATAAAEWTEMKAAVQRIERNQSEIKSMLRQIAADRGIIPEAVTVPALREGFGRGPAPNGVK